MLTGIVFGLLPALRASRTDPWTTMKDTMGSITGTRGSLFLRKGLVTAQVALSFLLLFGAGLFVRSLQNLKTTDTGVRLENLLTFQLSPALSGYDDNRGQLFYQQLLDRLRSAPGVKSAALASVAILAGDEWDSSMSVEGYQFKDGEDMQAFMNAFSPGYFETMNIPLLEGRDFRISDAKREATVAIVNRRFADHFFPGKSAIGKHIGFGGGPRREAEHRNHRRRRQRVIRRAARGRSAPGVHSELGQEQRGVLRAHADAVRDRVCRRAQRGQATRSRDAGVRMKTVEGQLDETLLTDRLVAMLSAGFGFVATLLASVGLYGVMAFVVAQRKKELGIRLALGAQPGFVIWLVMREVLLLLAIGLAVGIPAAMGLGQYVAAQLYGIQARDPLIATSTVLLLTIVSALAGLIPAQRASRTDPMLALRQE